MDFKPDFARKTTRVLFEKRIENTLFAFAIIGFIAVFIDMGGAHGDWHPFFDVFYRICLLVYLLLLGFRAYLNKFFRKKRRERWLVWTEVAFIFIVLAAQLEIGFLENLSSRGYLHAVLSLIFLVEISKRSLGLENLKVNPPLLFIFSFLILIFLGTLALMLPISTVKEISFINALFTSTSAVCVTGLTVLDTGAEFTRFGQNVILLLISLGGLGVMTFTSFFGFFFKGETSFRNQLIYRDFTGQQNLADVFSTIVKIVTLTVGIELLGAAILFSSLNPADFPSFGERVYFAIFHAVSAFNNAGFQLKSAGLYDPILRENYVFQMTVACLIIFGGLGFYIVFNIVKYVRERLKMRFRQLVLGEAFHYTPWVINLNTRIVLLTTLALLIGGTLLFFITDQHKALAPHDGLGKWVVAFFCSVTPRTAGFNNIDMAMLSREGILATIFLMWIGGSPGSTAGGIKTSTFAVATLGIFNVASGRDHIEFGKREVARESLLRAFIIICLSLISLGFATFALSFFEKDTELVKLVFECFSAYSTVGLSLGITSGLTDISKLVLVLTMFVGRVGAFTILLGIIKTQYDAKFYRYPVENIIIT